MMNPASHLEVLNVAVEYSGKAALFGVDMGVPDGQIVALIGPNGAGKSTLLKAIMGFAAVASGEIRFCGRPIQNGRPSKNVHLGIGYLAQGAPAFVELTVMQNLSIAGMHLKKGELRQRIEEMLALFSGLSTQLNQRAGALSGGERQMLGLARSFIGKPKLLLLDEPSSGLHPKVTLAVFQKLRQLNSLYGTGMLIVEQNIPQILDISSLVYGLKQGRVVECGNPESFRDQETLRSLFIG